MEIEIPNDTVLTPENLSAEILTLLSEAWDLILQNTPEFGEELGGLNQKDIEKFIRALKHQYGIVEKLFGKPKYSARIEVEVVKEPFK